jgi:DNA-binding MarR family transcriptional regulator
MMNRENLRLTQDEPIAEPAASTGGAEPSQPLVDEALPESTRRVIWLLRRLVQASELYSKYLQKNYSVTQHQLACLLALFDSGPLPESKLAQTILVKPSTITGIIDRLEQKGLVARERSARDRRIVNIQLTDTGNELVKQAPPPIQKAIINGLKNLSELENIKVVKSLEKLVAMLKEEA